MHPLDGFMAACRNETTEAVPVWFMRQAGRSLPEYRSLRNKHSILDLCRSPELAAEVTLQPVLRHGVDAAILFSDIVVPLMAMSVDLEIREGVGPVVHQPIRSESDLQRLERLDPLAGTGFVLEAVKILKQELEVPLIGFAGGPFTLACYLIEGGPSRDHARTRALMHAEPGLFARLLDHLAESIAAYLGAQIEAGADAVQLFDSWIGTLSPSAFERHVLPSVQRIFATLAASQAPTIYFGVGTGELLGVMARSGADVIGVDWRVPLDEARVRVGDRPVQGNLDPAICLAGWDAVRTGAAEVLRRGGGHGHIFNLGHGVHPDTDPGVLSALVDYVHGWRPDA